MYAVVETSGTQLKVQAGDEFEVNLLDSGTAEVGQQIILDRVLLVSGEAGLKIGAPYIEGATVSAEIIDPYLLGDKIYIYKHRPKSTYKRKTGHRQPYTAIRITGINA